MRCFLPVNLACRHLHYIGSRRVLTLVFLRGDSKLESLMDLVEQLLLCEILIKISLLLPLILLIRRPQSSTHTNFCQAEFASR